MSLETFVRDLRAMGVACTVLESGADGALLVTPECGRVLGLWPHWRGDNALWADPAFLGSLAFGAKDDGWRCPGGDRMWLAPAAEFLEDGRTPPPSVDPGSWEPQGEKGAFAMENRGDALAWKSGVRVGFRIHRRIRALGEAEMEERWGVTWLRRAGYEEEAGLELTEGRLADARLWNTVRVRSGSEWRSARGLIGDAQRIMHVEDTGSGHALLLVRDFPGGQPADPDPGPDALGCCSSPCGLAGRHAAGRLAWTLSLCAFSGRAQEVGALEQSLRGGS